MSLDTNSVPGTTRTLDDIKKLLINEFQNLSSKDQYMNEMIEIQQKPRESVWKIDQRFKRLKGKLKYLMTDMQHRRLFFNSLLPHLKYLLQQQKLQVQAEALHTALQLEENQYQQTDPAIEELEEDLKNLTFQLNQNKNKDKREAVWCTTCRMEGHHVRINAQHSHSIWQQECQTHCHREDYGAKYVRNWVTVLTTGR
jgi:DNA repair exonuclease SbcCD ATPase subunit